MIVTVHLHTVLQRQTPEGVVSKLEVPLAPESTLKDLLAHLEIDFPLDSMLLVLNGHLVEADHELHEADQVNLMPAISGGETRS
jgi:sulfur carrier protein ThiS